MSKFDFQAKASAATASQGKPKRPNYHRLYDKEKQRADFFEEQYHEAVKEVQKITESCKSTWRRMDAYRQSANWLLERAPWLKKAYEKKWGTETAPWMTRNILLLNEEIKKQKAAEQKQLPWYARFWTWLWNSQGK